MTNAPVAVGSALYFSATVLVIIWFWAFSRGGYITKDSFHIVTVVVATLGVATWLMWLCAWMHQWHPLIYPTWAASE